MKRMWSKNELKNIADNQAKEVKKDITTLVDADGHNRFISGDLTLKEIEGVTKAYGKWSLSGTHLLIVLAINVANTTAIEAETVLVENVNVPDWIREKIVPTAGTLIDIRPVTFYASNWSNQSSQASFTKSAQNNLVIRINNSITFTANRTGRIVFDLLID